MTIDQQSFQSAVATLGEPDTFGGWTLDSGNLRAFLTAYLSWLAARGMRVIQESELQNAEGALFNAEQYFKMFADEITSDYPARAADDESRPHRLGLCAKLAGESARELYALIYGEPYQEPVYCGPDHETPTAPERIGKSPNPQSSIEQNLKTQSDGGKG